MKENDFLQFVAGIFEVSAESLSLETSYNSIPAWDSVMQLRIVMEIEAAYGVDIPIDRVAELKTLAQFYELVKGVR